MELATRLYKQQPDSSHPSIQTSAHLNRSTALMTTLANTSILNMSKFIQVFTLLVAVTATVAIPLTNKNDQEQDRRLSDWMKNMIMSVTPATKGQEPSIEAVHITGNSGGTADYNSEIGTTTTADYNSEISTTTTAGE